jgi:N-acetylmuramoyl-L-alanine amidase
MRKNLLYILIFISSVNIFSQPFGKISVVTKTGTKEIPTYNREKTLYFSIKDFADATSSNYYYNDKNGKVELKYENYLLKVTAKNPYFIITERETGKQIIYQLPTSSYIFNNAIFIPLASSIKPIEFAWGKRLTFNTPSNLIVGDKIPDLETPFSIDKTETSTVKSSFDITDISISEKANGTLITVYSKKRIPSYYSSHKDSILSIIFRQVNADTNRAERTNLRGLVKEVKTKNVGADTEFKITVGENYSTEEVMNDDGGNNILITIHNKLFTNTKEELKTREKWEFDVIVIDAGHGGKDPGALGVGNVKEKDVTLGVALKLGHLIQKNMPDVKVVYTRKTDSFVDIYKRGKIANENDGKLFISIHCNSTKKKPTDIHGIEVYLLRPGRTDEAIAIAERENSVIEYEDNPNRYEKLTDENFILVSMAHSAYMKYSERFADMLNNQFRDNTKLKARGVKQAGFYVLVGASMPSVLIETGFINNKKDANYLKSKSGQTQLSEAIFSAINEYRDYYEKQMNAEL